MTKTGLQFVDVGNSPKDFGKWLREHRKAAQLSMDALGEKVGMSKQYISVLERAAEHPLTDKPITPKRDKVEVLAKAVGGDPREALSLAGYATESKNLPSFITETDFSIFTDSDLREIENFIKFKASQMQRPEYKLPEHIPGAMRELDLEKMAEYVADYLSREDAETGRKNKRGAA